MPIICFIGEEKEEDNESTDDLEAGVDSKLNTVDDNVYANLANTEIDVNNLHAFIKGKSEDEFKEEYEVRFIWEVKLSQERASYL